MDLVVTHGGDSKVSVLTGLGDGTFTLGVTLASGRQPIGVQVADMNGDAVADLIVSDINGNEFWIHVGTGGLSFDSPQVFQRRKTDPSPGIPFSLCARDLDGDQLTDLLVGYEGWGEVGVFLNRLLE